MNERCGACGTNGVINSMGLFVSNDWLRASELRAALSKVIAERDELLAALTALEKDNHTYQTRPCPTCRKITETLSRPFGCNAKELKAAIAKSKP